MDVRADAGRDRIVPLVAGHNCHHAIPGRDERFMYQHVRPDRPVGDKSVFGGLAVVEVCESHCASLCGIDDVKLSYILTTIKESARIKMMYSERTAVDSFRAKRKDCVCSTAKLPVRSSRYFNLSGLRSNAIPVMRHIIAARWFVFEVKSSANYFLQQGFYDRPAHGTVMARIRWQSACVFNEFQPPAASRKRLCCKVRKSYPG